MRISDWSSDVCSSDLGRTRRGTAGGSRFGLFTRKQSHGAKTYLENKPAMRLAELCDFASKLVKYGADGRKRPKHKNSIILGGLFSRFCKCLYRIFKTGNLYRPSRDERNGYVPDSRPAVGGGIDTADLGTVIFQSG